MPKGTRGKGKRMQTNTETMEQTGVIAELVNINTLVGTVQELLPEELVVEEALNVRPFEGDGKKEQERVEDLARSIQAEGQLQDGGVYPVVGGSGEIEYHLFMGHRRRNAIALLNAEMGKDEEAIKMRVRVFTPEDAKELRRKAIHENMKRKNFSPMDLALNIQQVRAENDWQAGKDTKT